MQNPVVEGRLRRFDCSQMTDGGAGVVLVSDDCLRDHPAARPIGRIDGWGHRTVGLGLQTEARPRTPTTPLRAAPRPRARCIDAFDRAHVTLDDVDGFEVHDCFTPSEYLAIDHIGLTGPGESWKAIENGEIEIGGRLPINPSGGLIGGGHPVGATGVRMLLDAAQQVSGTAGDYQVDGATTFGTLNFGGSTATTVSFVVGSATMSIGTHPEVVGKFLSTLPEDDDHPYRTGPWRPQTTEWDADDLTVVEGEIPRDLDGVYLRNTENPLHPALKFYHPFDGDGMLHVVGFRDGKAFYRNRFVRTDGFAEENEAGGPLWPGTGRAGAARQARLRLGRADADEGRVEHRRHRAPRHRADELLPVRRPLPGRPAAPATTLGKEDWSGAFPVRLGRVGAPQGRRRAPASCCSSTTARRRRTCTTAWSTTNDDLVHYVDVPLPGPRLPHDMAFTENYVDPQRLSAVLGSRAARSATSICRASTATCRRGSR